MLNILKRLKRKVRRYVMSKRNNTPWLPPQYNNIELGNMMFGNSRGQYQVERGEFEEAFMLFLQNNSFDNYGHYYVNEDQKWVDLDENISYENATFLMRPYYWGYDEEVAKKPNFIYKPRNLEIQWYKYPFRDAYSNEKFTIQELKTILEECERSMKNA